MSISGKERPGDEIGEVGIHFNSGKGMCQRVAGVRTVIQARNFETCLNLLSCGLDVHFLFDLGLFRGGGNHFW